MVFNCITLRGIDSNIGAYDNDHVRFKQAVATRRYTSDKHPNEPSMDGALGRRENRIFLRNNISSARDIRCSWNRPAVLHMQAISTESHSDHTAVYSAPLHDGHVTASGVMCAVGGSQVTNYCNGANTFTDSDF